MNINFYGCEHMPNTYPLPTRGNQCGNSQSLGWYSAIFFVFLVIIGGLVLPTVLIGVVAIAFEKASTRRKAEQLEKKKIKLVT